MDVRCDQCGTEYEFDDERVAREPITVKCANCGFIFRIQKDAARGDKSPRLPIGVATMCSPDGSLDSLTTVD